MSKTTEQAAAVTAPAFDKAALKASAKFRERDILVEAVLEDGKTYTVAEAEKAIKAYLERRVN